MRKLIPVAAVAALIVAAPALANGGKDIANAPTAAFGTQQFGNTASDNGQDIRYCSGDDHTSWWKMDVTAGDRISIDWDAPVDHVLQIFRVGVTDFTVENSYRAASDENGNNGKGQLVLKAGRSGSMPVVFIACDEDEAGPYSFTAYVEHGLAISVPRLTSLRRRGTVDVAVRTPEGNAIASGVDVAIQVKRDGVWGTVGRAPTQNGSAAVGVKIPRSLVGRRVRLRARASGPGYQTKATSSQRVKIK